MSTDIIPERYTLTVSLDNDTRVLDLSGLLEYLKLEEEEMEER